MAYQAEISRNNPTAILFLVDQSGSMMDSLSNGKSKAGQVADVLNRTLATLITRCTKAEGTRDYFEVGVIGYNSRNVGSCLNIQDKDTILHPISEIEAHPLRIEDRYRKFADGCGGVIEQAVKFPIWFEPQAVGGTPMKQALAMAGTTLLEWSDEHFDAYPPTILHITDGEGNDGNPEEVADALRAIRTNDGNLLFFNLHVSSKSNAHFEFPSAESELPDPFAKMLFRMSSFLPDHVLSLASEKGFNVSSSSKGFMYNADAVQIVDFFDIGTRALQQQLR